MTLIASYKALGLYNNVNELEAPNGAMSVADNVLISKDNVIESRPGFEACQDGLPLSRPLQMFIGKGSLFVHANNTLYIKDSSSCSYSPLASGVIGINNVGGMWRNGEILYFSEVSGHVIRFVNLSNKYVGTIAGQVNSAGHVNAIGTLAKFDTPTGIWGDGTNLYVCDSFNSTVRKVQLSNADVTDLTVLLAGAGPQGIWGDGTNLYVTDVVHRVVWKIIVATGVATVFAGAVGIPGTTDGIGGAARFNLPSAMTSDGTYLYVVDSFSLVRKIEIATGNVVTIFTAPFIGFGIGYDSGNLYYKGGSSFFHALYRMNITGLSESIFAGSDTDSGYVDGPLLDARFTSPERAYVSNGIVYSFDSALGGNYLIRGTDIPTSMVSTISGTFGLSTIMDGPFGSPALIGPN